MYENCSKCGIEKPLESFYLRKTGPRAGEYYEKCIECYKKRERSYYHKNRIRQSQLAKERKNRYLQQREAFLLTLKNKPCHDCGKIYPSWVMDFNHRDGKTKIDSISNMFFRSLVKFDKIQGEIEKCDLVCSNCHRDRTYKRLHNLYKPR